MNGMSPSELLASLQSGACLPAAAAPQVVVVREQQQTNNTCVTTGPTNATVVDSQRVGGAENCEVLFIIDSGGTASTLHFGGGKWGFSAGAVSKETVLGLTDNGSWRYATVTSDIGNGSGALANTASLIEWNDTFRNGVLVTGMCIDVTTGTTPTVRLNRIDGSLDNCSRAVIKPLCPACPVEGSTELCYDFTRILDATNFVDVTLAANTTLEIRLSTKAYATAPALVPCA